jgi:hypothetical protein
MRFGYERVPGGGWRWANKLRGMLMSYEMSKEELEKLETWAIKGAQMSGGTKYKAMTYEDGVLDTLGILTAEHTVEDITGEG